MDKKKRKRPGFFGLTARALMLSAAGLLLLSYMSTVTDPAKAWFMTFFGLLFVPAALLNLFLLVWAIRRRSKAGLIPLVVLIPAYFLLGRYLQLSGKEAADAENGVKIVSYNVGKFVASELGFDIPTCEDSVVRFLNNLDADIICLQEYRIPAGQDVKKYLKKNYPGYYASYHVFEGSVYSFGNITLTKYPIKNEKSMDFESTNLALHTDVEIDGTRLRIYNCHFESYGLSPFKIASAIVHRREDEVKAAEDKMRQSIIKRSKQVEDVFADIENCPTESFVIGDFNDTPLSYTYHRLKKGREDSFVKAGKGFGATYYHLWPFVRIDYILSPKICEVLGNTITKVKMSDHYPVSTTIRIKKEN